jgi:DNA-binding LytR/AlgR family response regulator
MIRCIVIEDEPLAVDVLVDYINQVPGLELKATCSDALQALEVLNREPLDLIFLDIHLPGLKGLDFLETLVNPPKVILTTAYHEYALKSYEHNVVDYLLKPIEFKRFVQAVNKVQSPDSNKSKGVISIHSDKKTVLIPIDDILYVESQKEYVRFQTKTTEHTSKYGLSKLEGELDSTLFLRIHRSFIVAISKITAYNNQSVEVDGKSLPIGGNYKDSVNLLLSRRFSS